MSAVDIGKICFIAGLTFWLGNITALGIGMATVPEAAGAVDRIPPWVNQAIGIAALSVLSIYLMWVWGKARVLGRTSASVALPSGSMTLLQIGIGLADLSCCSLVMYLLMPSLPVVDFIPLAVIVVFGTLLGFASHAPGAIGALDAAMLIGLPTSIRRIWSRHCCCIGCFTSWRPSVWHSPDSRLSKAYVYFRKPASNNM